MSGFLKHAIKVLAELVPAYVPRVILCDCRTFLPQLIAVLHAASPDCLDPASTRGAIPKLP